jgi:hypothetical protein
MPKGNPRNAGLLGLILTVTFAAYPGASALPQAPAAGGSKLPDILGITTGMAPQQAYELLKTHDPGHTVALTQWTVPQIYGDKPITLGMNTANTGMETVYVALTMPPNAQAVWHIHRSIPQFTSTKTNVLNSLYQKYGMPWNPYPGTPRNTDIGSLQWFFDEQGRPVNPTAPADVLALKNCVNSTLQIWYMAFPAMPAGNNGVATNSVTPGGPRTTVETVPPVLDPSKSPQCNNLIYVTVSVNGGVVRDTDLNFYLDFQISDYTMQHRAGVALNDALNAVVTKGAQQQRNDAQQQSVPKF